MASDHHTHRLASVMSALDELQERRELSDSARGRLRGLLSAPLEQFSGVQGGPAGGLPPRSSGLIRQSSRLSGMLAYHAKRWFPFFLPMYLCLLLLLLLLTFCFMLVVECMPLLLRVGFLLCSFSQHSVCGVCLKSFTPADYCSGSFRGPRASRGGCMGGSAADPQLTDLQAHIR